MHTVHAGEALLAPASTRRLIEQFARPPERSPALAGLTGREHDVLSLLAKLGLRDRVQAVVFAYESGLIRPGAR